MFFSLVYVLLWNVLRDYQLGECFCLWYKQWQIIVKVQQTLNNGKKEKIPKHQTLNYSRKRKSSTLKEKRRGPRSVHRRKANFYFICTFRIDFFNLIFFGQNVINENIYTLWFPFSSAAGFLSLLHQTRGGTGSSCTVRGSEVLWKKPCPAGLARGTMCAGGSLARRRKGQTAERVDDLPASPVSILESNCVAAYLALQPRFEQPSLYLCPWDILLC